MHFIKKLDRETLLSDIELSLLPFCVSLLGCETKGFNIVAISIIVIIITTTSFQKYYLKDLWIMCFGNFITIK